MFQSFYEQNTQRRSKDQEPDVFERNLFSFYNFTQVPVFALKTDLGWNGISGAPPQFFHSGKFTLNPRALFVFQLVGLY